MMTKRIVVPKVFIQDQNWLDGETGACSKPVQDVLFPLLKPAAHALASGAVIGIPTETVYGLGASIAFPEAIERIFTLKGRPNDNPLIVHVGSKRQIAPLVRTLSLGAQCLIDHLMPGPLTLVLPRSDLVPDAVTAGGETVGIRLPELAVARALMVQSGQAVAAPSANLSGTPSPTSADHVLADFSGRIPYVVDAGYAKIGLESTVLDLTDKPVILRPGAYSASDILNVLLKYEISFSDRDWQEMLLQSGQHQLDDVEKPRAPGMKYRHYAPSCPVIAYQPPLALTDIASDVDFQASIGIMLTQADWKNFGYHPPLQIGQVVALHGSGKRYFYCYGEMANSKEAGQHFYHALRSLDQLGVQSILVPRFEAGEWVDAYLNRLEKACQPRPAQLK